ncbi:MAG: glycogen/starch synthase, partial [Rhodothermales bacterium]
MPNPTRILFVSDEVDPFSKLSETAKLVRTIPEKLQDSGDFEVRIMMPRYGDISERKNRLHEVIRLSGTEILMGDRKETLKVKVAS